MLRPRAAFTLIEILVVISILTVLISLLLPALSSARFQAQAAACASQLRQIGTAVFAYAGDFEDRLPCGPDQGMDPAIGQPWHRCGTSQIWIGDTSSFGPPNLPPRRYNSLGKLLEFAHLAEARALFCPADDAPGDPAEELARIATAQNAFCSYLARQLDETSSDRLSHPGTNSLNRPARMLAMDRQSLIPGLPNDQGIRTNHENRRVHLLFLDGHVRPIAQFQNRLAIGPAFLFNPPQTLDRLIQNADHAETASLQTAPNP